MSANGTVVVHAAGADVPDVALTRLVEFDADSLITAVRHVEEPATLLVAVDPACADDAELLVAVVSVLVIEGVRHVETGRPQVVRRILDTHRAICAGAIEVLDT